MALLISVTPAGEGWAVHADVLDQPLAFARGGRAEQAARAMAGQYAQAGHNAEVRIFLKDGALAGRILHPARGEPTLMAG